MPISLTLPLLEQPKSIKDMVFIILTHQYPLSLIELLNIIKKQYAVSVSFQAVRKAVLELQHANVIIKDGKKFSLSREWILQLIKFGNTLQKNYFTSPQSRKKTTLQVGPNLTIYTLPKLVDLDYVWNGIIRESLSQPQAPKIITFKAVHFWFLLATLAQETQLIQEMLQHGIKLYYICYGNTPLDKWAVQMYNRLGVHCIHRSKPHDYDLGLNIGTYGNYLIQTTHPQQLAKKIDHFFRTTAKVEDASLTQITQLVIDEQDIPLTIQYDHLLAQTFRENVLREWKNTT